MKKKSSERLLVEVLKRKPSFDILGHVCVRNGVAMATDIKIWVTATVIADNGVYDGDAWRSGRMVPSIEKVEDYPDPPVMGKHIANITSDGIGNVIMSLPVNDRFNLPGALLVVNGRRKALIATDGHRMHVYGDHKLEGRNFIISKDVFLLLMERDSWGIYEGKKNDFLFFVGDDGVTIITKIIDQKFPNYREVIPDQLPPIVGDEQIIECVAYFHRELKRMKVIKRNNAIYLERNADTGNLRLTRDSSEKGLFFCNGPKVEAFQPVVFNGDYIADIDKIPGKKKVHLKDDEMIVETERGLCVLMALNV